MNFTESENYLFSLGNEVETMKLGLENIRTLFGALGEPQKNYRKVQVAGTNGKGSVCAFLDSICLEAGIRTGRYTSPHLVSVRERIKIGGVDIGETEFARHATRVRETSESLVAEGVLKTMPTFFEQVTAIALLAFADARVELAILETGLGGRFDATTAADAEIAVITRIDLDHQEYLGHSIREIAAEKAAIIRPASTAIVGPQCSEAKRVIQDRCREVGVEPVRAGTVLSKSVPHAGYPFQWFDIKTERTAYRELEPRMLGVHQAENAAIAVTTAEQLAAAGFGISIGKESIRLGICKAVHPGRLEIVGPFLLDGAHNPAGARSLAAFVGAFAAEPPTMIFGAMRDKEVAEVLSVLAPVVGRIILASPANARSATGEELRRSVPASLERRRVEIAETVESALASAGRYSSGGLILVTGSLYLVGEVRKILKARRSFEFGV